MKGNINHFRQSASKQIFTIIGQAFERYCCGECITDNLVFANTASFRCTNTVLTHLLNTGCRSQPVMTEQDVKFSTPIDSLSHKITFFLHFIPNLIMGMGSVSWGEWYVCRLFWKWSRLGCMLPASVPGWRLKRFSLKGERNLRTFHILVLPTTCY